MQNIFSPLNLGVFQQVWNREILAPHLSPKVSHVLSVKLDASHVVSLKNIHIALNGDGLMHPA